MSLGVADIVAALRQAGCDPRRSGSGWKARCPAHEDSQPSLSVGPADNGGVAVHCFSGCTPAAVVQALGCTLADLMPDDGRGSRHTTHRPGSNGNGAAHRELLATADDAVTVLTSKHGAPAGRWEYRNADGELAGIVLRWNLPAGGKDIRPVARRRGGWTIGAMDEPRPLYRLPELLADATATVFVCEGEKAADAAVSLGLVATTSAGGAQAAAKSDWSPLSGRAVVLLPDHDEPGRRYARDVAAALHKLSPPAVVRFVDLPGLPDGGDVVDFVDALRDGQDPADIRAEIQALAAAAQPQADHRGAVLVRMSDVEPEALRWLWPGRIALGKLTLLAGDPGLGKSFLTLDLAARVSTGTAWPDATGELNPSGGVVLLSAEDDPADTIRPRLDSAQADPSRIVLLKAVERTDPDTGAPYQRAVTLADLEQLEAAVLAVPGCKLVVIDPVSAFMGGADSHVNAEVRSLLAPLGELAMRRGVAIVAVTHLRKGDGAAVYRAMGSLAFIAAARAAWAVTRDKLDQSGRRRLMLPIKNNMGPDQAGLAFELRDMASGPPTVAWDATPVRTKADEALELPRGRGRPAEDLTVACDWLERTLAAGPRLAREMYEEGTQGEGLTRRTIERARQELKVRAFRESVLGPWVWELPQGGAA